jgi:hypothetical protein
MNDPVPDFKPGSNNATGRVSSCNRKFRVARSGPDVQNPRGLRQALGPAS